MIYREDILEIYRNPHHFKELKEFDFSFQRANPLCGDNLSVKVKLNGEVIEDLGFAGEGCVFAIVGASIVGDLVLGKNLKLLQELTKEDILYKIGLREILPERERCLTLGLLVLKEALLKKSEESSKKRL